MRRCRELLHLTRDSDWDRFVRSADKALGKLPAETRAQIENFLKKGSLSDKEVARRFSVRPIYLSYLREKLGLPVACPSGRDGKTERFVAVVSAPLKARFEYVLLKTGIQLSNAAEEMLEDWLNKHSEELFLSLPGGVEEKELPLANFTEPVLIYEAEKEPVVIEKCEYIKNYQHRDSKHICLNVPRRISLGQFKAALYQTAVVLPEIWQARRALDKQHVCASSERLNLRISKAEHFFSTEDD